MPSPRTARCPRCDAVIEHLEASELRWHYGTCSLNGSDFETDDYGDTERSEYRCPACDEEIPPFDDVPEEPRLPPETLQPLPEEGMPVDDNTHGVFVETHRNILRAESEIGQFAECKRCGTSYELSTGEKEAECVKCGETITRE